MKPKTTIAMAIAAASLIGLSGCDSDPTFTAKTPKQFENQYFSLMKELDQDERDQYELAVTTLVIYSEEQVSPDEFQQGEHLRKLAGAIHGKTPSEVIEMVSDPQYAEYRERAMQIVIFKRDPQWEDISSSDVSADLSPDQDIASSLVNKVRILDASVSSEDGLRSYRITLENGTDRILDELVLELGLMRDKKKPLDGQRITYSFPAPLDVGGVHQIDLRLNRPSEDRTEDEPGWFGEATLSGEIISLRTADGEVFSRK